MSDSEQSDHLERRIDRYEHRLLKREHLHRRNFHAARALFLLTMIIILAPFLIVIFTPLGPEAFNNSDIGIVAMTFSIFMWLVITLGVMFTCRAKLRHIESIRNPPHLRKRKRCPMCDYDLKDLSTDGCPECGWSR